MRPSFSALLYLSLLLLTACEKEPGYHVEEYQQVRVEELAEDIKIPAKAWDLLEFKTTNPEASEAAPVAKNISFAEVSVFLVQKNAGIVEGEAVKISLPKGGGAVDLSRYITGEKGTFYLGFEFPAFETATAQKVIFISGARKRRVGHQIFGAGCNQVLDITDKFLTSMQKAGLKLNTTQERYISVIGGTFLFSAQSGGDILIAQVTFRYPQYRRLFCEEK